MPHLGCPNACSFCDQRGISGAAEAPTPGEVSRLLEAAQGTLAGRAEDAEIAFFGGSFTAIEGEYRRSLLGAAQPFLGSGGFAGIRVSTRPDAVDDEVLAELGRYGVTAVELGAQSMSDEVLRLNRRGHTAKDVEDASRRIREHGFSLGLQMMTGLYGDSGTGALYTVERLAALAPDAVRIYPAVVLRGTYLAELCAAGAYRPQEPREAVGLCARLLEYFTGRGIPVIRLGLQESESLRESRIAGPYHPAFRELCEGRILLERALGQLRGRSLPSGPVLLTVGPGSASRMAGQRRQNLLLLREMGYLPSIAECEGIGYLDVRVS